MSFFTKSIMNDNNPELLSDLSIDGFYCIQSFFIMLNDMGNKLKRLNEDSANYKGIHYKEPPSEEKKDATTSSTANATSSTAPAPSTGDPQSG